MLQHSTPDLQPDLIPHEEFDTKLPRADLMPWWMHLMLAFTLLMSLIFASVCAGLILEDGDENLGRTYVILYRVALAVIVTFGYWISAGCVLLWSRWKHAVVFMIIPSCIMAVFMVIATVGTVRDQSWDGFIFALIFLLLLISVTIRLFLIQQEWKMRCR